MTPSEILGWLVALVVVATWAWWHRRVVAHHKSRTNYYKQHVKVLEEYTRVIESNHRRLLDHVTHASHTSLLERIRSTATSSRAVSPRYEREVLP